MPFKLRIRKTRHYNVISRNVLVLSVELVDKTTLECTLSADSSGLDCLHNVCQRLSLQQPEFFGLRYMSKRPYPKVRWVELDRPLKKQLDKYAQSPALFLAVQYYIHDVGLLQDDVSRSHYFLQVKQDVLEGKLRCNYEQAVLLASYSLQADFGDHQPERHTPEYLKDFRLFPKQAISEGEVGSLLEAVVWQYSSLTGLAQALAETYYILEAQRLPGYGQETFIARDEKGSEVYLGASLLGIVVEPASGAMQTFYRWNDITNLINHKRNFGIECSRSDETVHFLFEEPDAAKYVWKMCVKQHTFYKGNQDILEVTSGGMETRSLAIPDLQSSVMSSYKNPHGMNSASAHELVKSSTMLNETLREDFGSRTFASSMSHLEPSFLSKSCDLTSQGSVLDSSSHQNNHETINVMNPSAHQQNQTARFSIKQAHTLANPSQAQFGQAPQPPNQDVSNHHLIYSSDFNSSMRHSTGRKQVPQYRQTPDYETALFQKYGPDMNTRMQATMLYSSQPEISTQKKELVAAVAEREREGGGGNGLAPANYSQYGAYTNLSAYADHTPQQQQRVNPQLITGTLHNTYSTPELTGDVSGKVEVVGDPLDYHFIHGYKPPPPYPYNKPSSNSTPDLASVSKGEQSISGDSSNRKRLSLLTASLGCLGSPELSRTYENLSDLTEAVESLRHELTKGETSFLHSFAPNYSTDNLDAVYHVPVGQSFNLKNSRPIFNKLSSTLDSPVEPIYQNVGNLLSDLKEGKRGRAKSAPELDVDESLLSEDARLRAASHPVEVPFVTSQHTGTPQQNKNTPTLSINQPQQLALNPQRQVQSHYQQLHTAQPQLLQLQPHLQPQQLSQSQTVSHVHQLQLQHLQQQQPQQSQHLQQLQQPQLSQQPHHQQQVPQKQQTQHPQQAPHPQHAPHPQQHIYISQSKPTQLVNTTYSASSGGISAVGSQAPQSSPVRMGQRLMSSQEEIKNSPSTSKGQSTPGSAKDVKTKPDLVVQSPSTPIQSDPKALELQQKLASLDIVREFESIPRLKNNAEFTSSLRPENVPRNRYKDIIPYEENRVKITPTKDNKAGYINASHLTASVGNTQRFYICAQGPQPNTVSHFWQCVWETDVRLIVMLVSVEGDTNTSKSFPYWPQTDSTSVECDQFRIYRKQSTKLGSHQTSRLQLVHMPQRKSRSVWHLQYTDWADNGCPEDTRDFLSFLEELSTLRRVTFDEVEGVGKNRNTPVLVHCSAGVGRTGVTVLCDLLMDASRHNLPLDPPKLLLQLRQQRMALVQSFNQYKFVYKVLLASLQNTRLI